MTDVMSNGRRRILRRGKLPANASVSATAPRAPVLGPLGEAREKFLPLTRRALIERLTAPELWPSGVSVEARRFFRYLDFWRQQSYVARLSELEQTYEPFSPDSDLLVTRIFSTEERLIMQKRLVVQVRALLANANFTEIKSDQIEIIAAGSFYGLDLQLELSIFDEVAVFYRGSATRTASKRTARKLFLWKQEFDLPIFRRLCVLFKLKPFDVRVHEVMQQQNCDRKSAERYVRKLRSALPPGTSSDYVYLKLFKNIPHHDLEMVFPNTRVKFRLTDKVKFGVTAGSGLGMGVVGALSKLAVAVTPFGMAGAALAFSGVAARQVSNFVGQRNKYLVTMAQNLYFHAMADNRGVLTLLADRAAEEDVKEEMLLYAVLAKQRANVRELDDIDGAIERYLRDTYGFDADFDIDEALKRLMDDGIVKQLPDGTLDTLPPREAALHIDALWDSYLDNLPDTYPVEGQEVTKAPQIVREKSSDDRRT